MPLAILALGSNQNNPKAQLDRALAALTRLGTLKETAPYILSKPEGYDAQPDFVNTVCLLSTPYKPADLLRKLKELETELGRVKTFPNGPRVIDLDILFYDDQIIFDEQALLFVPHPRLHQREFVLKPLSYLLPDFVHPQLGKSIITLYRELMRQKGQPSCKIL
ncbi:2-amino-4-hydroxy-6-hydroxymethyldihydropteridine diphosphokinase [Candidatus Avelusimicrobium facis]|uniref:2-amino-4-hydroxy-6- hydroxymethyldihydropteridine diphosphokinase n=1 Tax=Candidatus Avelusimicrobium facis TaxID=3416203 RepID=UPI0015B5615D